MDQVRPPFLFSDPIYIQLWIAENTAVVFEIQPLTTCLPDALLNYLGWHWLSRFLTCCKLYRRRSSQGIGLKAVVH
jgi:hypothetical protein